MKLEDADNNINPEEMYGNQVYNSQRRIPADKKIAITHVGSKSTVIRLGEKLIEIPDHNYVLKLTEDTNVLTRKIKEQDLKIQRLVNHVNRLAEEINSIKSDLLSKVDEDDR